MGDIILAAREVVVDAQDVIALGEQALTQMRTEKPGSASDENTLGNDAHKKFLVNKDRKGVGLRSCSPSCGCPQFGLRRRWRAANADIRKTCDGHFARPIDTAQIDHERARQKVSDAAKI